MTYLSNKSERAHDWTESDSKNDNLAKTEPGLGIILVGQTGVGKSSLIKAMTGVDVKISHDPKSGTTEVKFYKINGKNIYYVDTKGTSDSTSNEESQITLKTAMQQCFFSGVRQFKVIWIVAEPTRSTNEFQKQAQFIHNLGKEGKYNVWDCCLIIVKDSPYNCGAEGPVDAAKQYGAGGSTISKNIFGAKCVDWIEARFRTTQSTTAKSELEMCKALKSLKDDYKNYGIFTENELRKEVELRLNNIKSTELKCKLCKCKNCGIEGNDSYTTQRCHLKKSYTHPNWTTVRYHTDQSWVHPGRETIKTVSNDTIYDDINNIGGPAYLLHLHPGVHVARLFQSNERNITVMSCCDKDPNSSGCKYMCGHCKRNDSGCMSKRVCANCNGELGSTECHAICAECKKDWGTGPCR
ncbi:hypothetical protein RFI_35830 [Reticulomyxa filosa]|uniref:G domain-containing protein n=1 Tax=Reticulomyxa filosa TaxID=46433 RepID=X6LLK3_RETFI|nr:hypothetical protein RFI_35830 [Reticulomyxa filosa]|eukprot:ETO01610.1 hypothetical protein RFI_35830 [Reticulomyxa filosa]